MELPDPVRQRLGNFSLTVFGDSSRTGPESSEAAGLKAAGPPPQTAETVGMPVQLPTDTDAGDAYGFHGSQNNFSQPPKREKSQDRKLIDNEMVSSLPLQMSLYFNSYFFPLWWVSCIVMLHMKYSVLPDYYKFIVITVIVLVTLMEAIRLYLGCMGNLQEKVPELAGFWLLSLLLQLPLILFLLLNEGLRNLPLEKAIHIIFTIFLTFQVISAFLTLKKMVNQLAARFHLQDFDRLSANSAAMTGRRQPFTEEL